MITDANGNQIVKGSKLVNPLDTTARYTVLSVSKKLVTARNERGIVIKKRPINGMIETLIVK